MKNFRLSNLVGLFKIIFYILPKKIIALSLILLQRLNIVSHNLSLRNHFNVQIWYLTAVCSLKFFKRFEFNLILFFNIFINILRNIKSGLLLNFWAVKVIIKFINVYCVRVSFALEILLFISRNIDFYFSFITFSKTIPDCI